MRSTITIYSEDEIRKLHEGGHILAGILGELVRRATPGVMTGELDALAEKMMREAGGAPSFKGYKAGGTVPFPGSVCTSINAEVVHAPPVPSRPVHEGDILKLDIGMRYAGLCTDMAVTVPIGKVAAEACRLMRTTRESLFKGVDVVRPGALVRDIGRAIQPFVEKAGFSVVRDLVGHGVGHEVHEDPRVPNYDDPDLPRVVLKKGMVIAIEPMINAGSWEVEQSRDRWTIIAIDGRLSAHFEVTVAVTDDGYDILTPLPV
jgi:methionyl aminopeptidase